MYEPRLPLHAAKDLIDGGQGQLGLVRRDALRPVRT